MIKSWAWSSAFSTSLLQEKKDFLHATKEAFWLSHLHTLWSQFITLSLLSFSKAWIEFSDSHFHCPFTNIIISPCCSNAWYNASASAFATTSERLTIALLPCAVCFPFHQHWGSANQTADPAPESHPSNRFLRPFLVPTVTGCVPWKEPRRQRLAGRRFTRESSWDQYLWEGRKARKQDWKDEKFGLDKGLSWTHREL